MELRRRRFGQAVRLEVEADVTPTRCASCSSASSTSPRRRSTTLRRAAGPRRAVGPARARPPRPQGRAVAAGHPGPPRRRRTTSASTSSRSSPTATCSSTTRTTRSPRRSRSSSARRRGTPRCSPSSSRCTARPATAPIIKSLIRAAERGKQVAALVELKARFDEAANIGWARALEQAGVHVTYGLVGLKTHTKTALVVRDEAAGVRRYCHIGTGNYNSKTARLYEDLGLLTADPADRRRPHPAVQLPHRLRPQRPVPASCSSPRTGCAPALEALIDGEMAAPEGTGRIVMKMNSLVDPALIDRLYAGVAGGRGDRPRRPRHLLPAPRGARPVRAHPGALDRRPLPRALAHLPLRQRRRPGRAAWLHRVGRPDAAQPRPPHRGARAGPRPGPAAPARRRSSTSTWPTTRSPGRSGPTGTWSHVRPTRRHGRRPRPLPAASRVGRARRLRRRCRAEPRGARRRRVRVADGSRRASRCCSSTGPATTTGRCPRASASAASPTRTAPCARWRRRSASGATSARPPGRRVRRPQGPDEAGPLLGDGAPSFAEFVVNDEVDEIRWARSGRRALGCSPTPTISVVVAGFVATA